MSYDGYPTIKDMWIAVIIIIIAMFILAWALEVQTQESIDKIDRIEKILTPGG